MAFDSLTLLMLESNRMFDKVAYQREYMRKRRAAKKSGIVVERFESVEGSTPLPAPAHASKEETLAKLREMMKQEHEKPAEAIESTDTRSRSDIAMGIWRNDQGGVISKFAWDKLQKMKAHARENNFEMDDYSQ